MSCIDEVFVFHVKKIEYIIFLLHMWNMTKVRFLLEPI